MKQKLYYVNKGDRVTKYHNDIIHLAEKLGYVDFYKHSINGHYYFTVEMFNEMVDWIIREFPNKVELCLNNHQ